jgi:hypothetical protein
LIADLKITRTATNLLGFVRKYGIRLMPEFYEHLNPMPFEVAVQMEMELAEDLRTAGYTVAGGH